MRALWVYFVLSTLKVISAIFFRARSDRIGWVPDDPWRGIRLVAFLNHTSLFEPIYLPVVPQEFVWKMARKGVVPAADKTTSRPLVGLLFKSVARHVVSITRERDHTWSSVLESIGDDSIVILAPEGRMMRRDGLDAAGKPMSVRGGIADIIREIPNGRFLIAYSGGLHHVQVPGERRVRPFVRVRIRFQLLDLAEYRERLGFSEVDEDQFKENVKKDLLWRRDHLSPVPEPHRHLLHAGREPSSADPPFGADPL